MKKYIKLLGIAFSIAPLFHAAATAAEFPSRPVSLIVPWSPGGSVDMTARKLGEAMAQEGIQVVVENVPGASGTIGLRKVAMAAPDGYTLGLATTSLMGAISQKITPLSTKDFKPLAQTTAEQEILLVPAKSSIKTIEDFVALMKTKSNGVSFGTPGAFTVNHVYGALLGQAVGKDLIHIAYGGGAKVLVDLAGGQIDAGILKPSEAKALIDGGQVRPIGAFSTVRSEIYPDVPTFQEKGIDLFAHGSLPLMSYIVAPKGTPDDVANKLVAALAKAMRSDGYTAFTKEYGMTGQGMTGSDLSNTIEEIQKTYDAILPNVKE